MSDLAPTNSKPTNAIVQRWGDAVSAGFTPVPNALLRAQAKLGINPTQMVVLLNILLHWWESERLPFPSTPAIAKRSGLSARTVQRCIRELERKDLLRRERGRPSVVDNKVQRKRARYDFSGLREKLEEAARHDVWYRPDVVRRAPPGTERRARTDLQNPNP